MEKRTFFRFISFLFLDLILLGNLSCEGKRDSESRSKANLPPVMLTVTILPEKAYKGSELSVAIQGKDPDGDPVTYRYQWIKNGQEMAGENMASLKGERFQKGDSIQIRVTPSDGKDEGRPFLSSPITILNSPPEIQEVSIEPERPSSSDNLTARVKASDPDGDFVYYSFRWEKNGEAIPQERAPLLERGRFRKGDSIAVTVIPDDREIQGTPKKSGRVLVSGGPPVITSSPPHAMEGETYRYQVKVHNPDQGHITFTLKSGPKGMVIDKDTGLIQWGIRKEDKGVYPIEIEVSDDEGAKGAQKYTLTVDFR